nr:uncharacterized protein LOC112914437 [Vulpes vulpes]
MPRGCAWDCGCDGPQVERAADDGNRPRNLRPLTDASGTPGRGLWTPRSSPTSPNYISWPGSNAWSGGVGTVLTKALSGLQNRSFQVGTSPVSQRRPVTTWDHSRGRQEAPLLQGGGDRGQAGLVPGSWRPSRCGWPAISDASCLAGDPSHRVCLNLPTTLSRVCPGPRLQGHQSCRMEASLVTPSCMDLGKLAPSPLAGTVSGSQDSGPSAARSEDPLPTRSLSLSAACPVGPVCTGVTPANHQRLQVTLWSLVCFWRLDTGVRDASPRAFLALTSGQIKHFAKAQQKGQRKASS